MLNADASREIEIRRQGTWTTRRSTCPNLETILFIPTLVLDHGFIRVVDYMGIDASIVQAARTSYGYGTKQISEDRALIHFLMEHEHMTPFEMCEIKFHIKMPIFVARQWIRHRMASVNEMSARYSILDKEFYIPRPEHMAAQSSTNRQGRGDVLDAAESEFVRQILIDDATRNYADYRIMLNEPDELGLEGDPTERDPSRLGLARELARMNLTLNTYTQWYWKVDLRNFMAFLKLRVDKHAQYEIRVYAQVLLNILGLWCPMAHDAFLEHQRDAVAFSATEMAWLKNVLNNPVLLKSENWASRGKRGERFLAKLGRA